MKRAVVVMLCAALAGCNAVNLDFLKREPPAGTAPSTAPRPVTRPEVPEAAAVEGRAETPDGPLGSTVVSLGNAAEPGLWLKTPLVARTRPGTVRWNGQSVVVTLVPIAGESGAGSRMSLEAMQALGMPLTELTEVQVTAG